MNRTWVITACHNRCRITRRFIDQLAAQTATPARVIVVDDGSRDGTPAALATERRIALNVIRGNGRLFWGGSMALGLQHLARQRPSDTDTVLLCNDDVRIASDFLMIGSRLIRPGVLALAQGMAPDGSILESGQVLDWRLRPRAPHPGEDIVCGPTRGLFVLWGDVRQIGNFIPDRLPHYLSDYEWTLRATTRGMRIRTDAALRLTMEPSLTGKRDLRGAGGLTAWRRMFSKTYAENPVYLARFAARAAPGPRAAAELLLQLLRAAILPLKAG